MRKLLIITLCLFIISLFATEERHVNYSTGKDSPYDGWGMSAEKPWKHISYAITCTPDNGIINLSGIFTLSDNDGLIDPGVVPSGWESGLTIRSRSLTFRGEDKNTTIIQAYANPYDPKNSENPDEFHRVMYVQGPKGDNSNTVTIENLTIRHGRGEPSGGIFAYGANLVVDNCIISNNTVWEDPNPIDPNCRGGGGIFVNWGNLYINNSIIKNNTNIARRGLGGEGGGICFFPYDELDNPILEIINSAILDNNAPDGPGGGLSVYNFKNPNMIVKIENTTFSGNTAVGGHAIRIVYDNANDNCKTNAQINSCTIVDNYPENVTSNTSSILLENYNGTSGSSLDFRNSIVSNKMDYGSSIINQNFFPTEFVDLPFTRSYTISDDDTMPLGEVGNPDHNVDDRDPLLTILRNEEGTSFYKLTVNSPAKDAIPSDNFFNGAGDQLLDADGEHVLDEWSRAITFDQLGNKVHNQKKDIGAYESPYYWIHQTGAEGEEKYLADKNHEILLHIADPIEYANEPTDKWKDYIKIETGGIFELDNNSSIYFEPSESFHTFEEGSIINVLPSTTEDPNNSRFINGNIKFLDNTEINIYENSTLGFQNSDVRLSPSMILDLRTGAKLEIQNGTNFVLPSGFNCALGQDAEITVLNKGRLETDNSTSDPISFTSSNAGETWQGIVGEVGSIISIQNCNFNGAETAINATAATVSISNSIFENCYNGVSLANCNSLESDDFTITNNTFTGKEMGTGVSIIVSDGIFRENSIENFNYGVRFVLSPTNVIKNSIFNNKGYGILISGHNAFPQLIPDTKNGELNNSIINNGSVSNTLYPYAQIGIMPVGSVYIANGMNNIYSGNINTIPEIPCISIANIMLADPPDWICIEASGNYWGSSKVTDDFFALEDPYYAPEYPYHINYLGWAEEPFIDEIGPQPTYSSNEPPSVENTLLSNAMFLEGKENYTASIKQYEQVIKKHENTPEYFVAMARLPYVYLKAGEDTESLIRTYDEAIASENTSKKKFFKEMKIATHIKSKKYDTAITLAEEMKAEAQIEEEIILADIDIAICNMMKNHSNNGKSKSTEDHSKTLNDLLAKLNEGEEEGDKTSIDNGQFTIDNYELFQNYPNPFNPVTQIKFALPVASNVKLNVYNINGQLVSELINEVVNAGMHSVNFDASNMNSGMYFYTLEANGMTITKKMVLTK